MQIKPAGSQWLKEHYHLSRHTLAHCSYIGDNESIELTFTGNIQQVYGIKYAPKEDTPILHLEFSLKYDTPNLDFLRVRNRKLFSLPRLNRSLYLPGANHSCHP